MSRGPHIAELFEALKRAKTGTFLLDDRLQCASSFYGKLLNGEEFFLLALALGVFAVSTWLRAVQLY